MNKPLLVVVTGPPATGKTTLSRLLASKIKCPLLSRDEFKEGLLNTLNLSHTQLDKSVDFEVYDTFFNTIAFLISKGISIIVEAAYQDKLWRPKLLDLLGRVEIKIILCHASAGLIRSRFNDRFAHDPDRERFHGDKSLSLSPEQFSSLTDRYQAVTIDAPTIQVDTTDNCIPDIDEILRFIRQ